MMGNSSTSLEPEPEERNDTIFADSLMKSAQPMVDNDTLVVLHDYPSPYISQPIFRIGEKLKVISNVDCWWRVHSVTTGDVNYIPQSHTAKVYHGWLFEGVTREKAEELLYLPGNKTGSFMIRESIREKGVYSLSVRHQGIKHYRINRLPNNWYYISPRLTFQCLEDLVNHYSDTADGLCCTFSSPCLTLSIGNRSYSNQVPPVVMRSNIDSVYRSEELRASTQCRPENSDFKMSFGLRNSIASYMTLAGFQGTKHKDQCKTKRKSIYTFPDNRLEETRVEDYSE
ncbi:hypothetical protein GJAV_G00017180 [Gymnothorax javanicus]|nr:hypothetical protein GJAV_G00017180 [Gymnothorax javanicus]